MAYNNISLERGQINKILECVRNSGLTMAEISRRSGLAYSTLGVVLKSKRCRPETLDAIMKTLNSINKTIKTSQTKKTKRNRIRRNQRQEPVKPRPPLRITRKTVDESYIEHYNN